MFKKLFFAVCVLFVLGCEKKTKENLPVLNIYTYSSFQGHYGAGPKLVKAFEKNCKCKVNLINAGDAGLIIQRLKIQKEDVVDLVIGLDQFSQIEAEKGLAWKSINLKNIQWVSELKNLDKSKYIPYDWSPMTFVYQQGSIDPASNFKQLLDTKYKKKIAIQDPRLSTPGLQFLMWILAAHGDKKGYEYMGKLTKSIYKVSPSWTSSYGLFQNKKAKIVFSYLTSPVYHWQAKKDFSIQPMVFEEGHFTQIEKLAIPEKCQQCGLAEGFIKLMLSEQGQKIIMNANFMLPVISGVTKGTLFEKLPKLKIIPMHDAYKKLQNKKDVLSKWKTSIGG